MNKKFIITAVMTAVCFMTACAQKPASEERGGIRVAVGDSGYQESRTEEDNGHQGSQTKEDNDHQGSQAKENSDHQGSQTKENSGHQKSQTEDGNNYQGSQAKNGSGYQGSRTEDGNGHQGSVPEGGEHASNGGSAQDNPSPANGLPASSAPSSGREISDILASCTGTKIEQSIEAAGGTLLLINAPVNVKGITGISQYEYILTDITEGIRADLFQAVFPEKAKQAVYDERNDVWTLDIDPAIRNYFLYQISYSNGGTTIPGEQIIVLENRYYDLNPFEDNRLDSISLSKISASPDEAESVCRRVVDSVTDTGDYTLDFIHAYGKGGKRPYLRLVFKRRLDGMPVTAYNDLAFLFDDNGIERVSGSLFSVKETGLEVGLLSPEEAVEKLREQAAFLDFAGESQVPVTEIALEYVTVMSPDGKILVTPVWRFLLGEDEDERNFLRRKLLGIDAVTGELLWEERGHTF